MTSDGENIWSNSGICKILKLLTGVAFVKITPSVT